MTVGDQPQAPNRWDDLWLCANEYLEACRNALNFLEQRAPDRQYVAPSPNSAWDCEQLTVHVGGPTIAPTQAGPGALAEGQRIAVTGTVNLVTLTATVVRCIPAIREGGSPPTPASLDEASMATCSDLWAIWSYLKTRHKANELFARADKRRELILEPAVSLGAEGGFGGWQIPIAVELSGFRFPEDAS